MVKRVLIAEDDPMDVFLIQRAFAAAGVSASMRFVRDGQEALDYLGGEAAYSDRQANPLPDLMLLDLKTPKVDGFGVLKWARGRPELKGLRVIVLNSSEDMRDVNAAYRLGPNSFLIKPMDFEDIAA